MNHDLAKHDVAQLQTTLAFQRKLIFGLGGCLIVSLLLMTQIAGRSTTTIVPPNLTKTIQVTNNVVNAAYLEQWGEFISHYLLNLSADNETYYRQIIREYTSASFTTAIERRMQSNLERLKRVNGTLIWRTKAVTPYEAEQAVAITGSQWLMINGQREVEKSMTWLARFDYEGGRLMLSDFCEAKNANEPFKISPVIANDNKANTTATSATTAQGAQETALKPNTTPQFKDYCKVIPS
jgi:type IV conjugative transfer system protein TraE